MAREYGWEWPDASIVRVIDGDTVVALVTRKKIVGPVDIGFHGSVTLEIVVPFEQHMRLMGINTPKSTTKRGREAKAAVEQLTLGQSLHIVTHKPYKYGDEWMAQVTLPDGSDLVEQLLAEKLGTAWDGTGTRPNDDV